MMKFKQCTVIIYQIRNFSVGYLKNAGVSKDEKIESPRLKKFHDQLKVDQIPRVKPSMRYVDLVLVETDPKNGELISDTEKDPTKWGDWQNGGRVTDF